ncbi:MAG: xanthine dehydrogenase family protein subunit M [Gammaproteobacteria bacterium]|jgi:carbon-monoxide dehydrogenase medium subunit|nr:xanthine dehydrogenase family protein subunit M [Gammaproteobacteria bacterium]MBP6050294.1 xanthine dehydrogenase family protein subunit M [Pseudomonadales bacterium]MBK6583787.1 xanthine dehydrogenase family protein subunit M [Gammaproteobacteria bacterium]MBK7171151.1 xanthine dehydrogenase family protein subunit M [Gammaproteobacteria bacterium]MBK7522124.1 xanthine dehydrogenase family protein subunit M [Gammaproteobacteria bacterium]
MKPAPFDYYAPETLEEAIALLVRFEEEGLEARIIAGGQSLMPMLSLRVARPEVLVDLRRIGGLDHIRDEGATIAIGAMASKRAAEDSPLVRERQPLFHAATLNVGHRAIRAQGSVGGSFANADPASEYPATAIALDMQLKAVGPDGERLIAARDFFVTYLTTDLASTEILTEVRMPVLAPGTGWSFYEVSRRKGDFAMAGCAVLLTLGGGRISSARIVVFGVNATAVQLAAAEQVVLGQVPDPVLFGQAGSAGAAEVEEPIADVHASADFRRNLVSVVVERGLAQALARATP